MNTNNCLYLAVLLILSACTAKTPSNETSVSKQDTLSENISLKLPSDTVVIDTVVTPPHTKKKPTFIPPVIITCEEVVEPEPERICSYPTPIPTEDPPIPQKPFTVVEQMPVFPGGDSAMMKFISENLKYSISDMELRRRVVLRFVVDKEGDIKDIEVLRSIAPEFDKEAIRVVKLMPRWNAGKQNGIPVDVYYTIPITFKMPHEQTLKE